MASPETSRAGASDPAAALPQAVWNDTPYRDVNLALGAMGQALARMYRFPIDKDEAETLASMDSNDENDLFMSQANCRKGAETLKTCFASGNPDATLQAARDDFHKLFVGPLTLRAIPWSSAYIDSDGLFGPTARAVRETFTENGFEIPEGRTEPSDHVAYELQFLAEMHKRAEVSWGCDPSPDEEARKALVQARGFKQRFIDPWIGDFLNCVDCGSRVEAYRGIADLTRGFLAIEDDFLNKVLAG